MKNPNPNTYPNSQKCDSNVKPIPAHERLVQLFSYDPATGIIRWNERPKSDFGDALQHRAWNSHHAGRIAGSCGRRYRKIGIGELSFLAHRIAWAMHYGSIPTDMMIDHINGDGFDNRIDNLRLVTNAENQRNIKPGVRSGTGVRGVYLNKRLGRYAASVRQNGKLVHLGLFDDLDEAALVASKAREAQGYSARHTGL